MFRLIETAYAAVVEPAAVTTPTIPVDAITAQVGTAIDGIIGVIVAVLPALMIIFATIIGLYLVLRLVGRVSRGK